MSLAFFQSARMILSECHESRALGMGRLPNVEDKQATNTGGKNITEIVTTTNCLFGEVISIRPNFNGFKAAKNVIWKNLLTSL